MKETITTTQSLEERKASGVGMLATAALVGALSVLSPSEGSAKTVSSIDEGAKVTEVTQPGTEVDEEKKTITLGDAIQLMQHEGGIDIEEEDGPKIEPDPDPDPEPQGEGEGEPEGAKDGKESRIGVHGFVQVGTSVVPDFAGIFSDKLSGMVCVDAKDQKTGLGLTVVRLDDFHTDPKYPLSRASVVVPYWTTSSKDGKRSAGASVEFSFIDQMPGTIGVTPVVVGTYSSDGWAIEGKYFHDFQEGKDMNAVRLGITKKKIGNILSLTGQLWYKSDYAGKVYGRVIVDMDLGGGFGAQLSCIARDGKLTPTAGVMYKFGLK